MAELTLNITPDVWSVLLAPLLTVVFMIALIGPARRFGCLDLPGGRKRHDMPTPLVGGAAIFLTLLTIALLREEIPFGSWSLFTAMLVALVFGLADDLRHFAARVKLFGQLVAALIVVSGTNVHVMQLGDLFGFGFLSLGKWSYLVTVVALIGLMNAVNMVDGIDGLAGSLVILPLTMFAILATGSGNWVLAMEIWILVGAIAGFLVLNLCLPWRQRALVFMGDVGALLLGLLLGWYAIKMAGVEHALLRPITAVWIVALPLLDMGSVMLLRVLSGKSPFHADRGHTHHLLLDAGYPVARVVALMSAISFLFCMIGLLGELYDLPEYLMFYAFMVVWGLYVWALSSPAKMLSVLTLRRKGREG